MEYMHYECHYSQNNIQIHLQIYICKNVLYIGGVCLHTYGTSGIKHIINECMYLCKYYAHNSAVYI